MDTPIDWPVCCSLNTHSLATQSINTISLHSLTAYRVLNSSNCRSIVEPHTNFAGSKLASRFISVHREATSSLANTICQIPFKLALLSSLLQPSYTASAKPNQALSWYIADFVFLFVFFLLILFVRFLSSSSSGWPLAIQSHLVTVIAAPVIGCDSQWRLLLADLLSQLHLMDFILWTSYYEPNTMKHLTMGLKRLLLKTVRPAGHQYWVSILGITDSRKEHQAIGFLFLHCRIFRPNVARQMQSDRRN